MRVGILALQGDVSEHRVAMENAIENLGISGEVIEVKKKDEIENLNALIIPGGESTTIGKLTRNGIDSDIRKLTGEGIPIMGTCAGLVLLAREGDEEVKNPLKLMDITVKRNAFGRQRDSFETELKIPALGRESYHAVFIRAPIIEKVGKEVEILARFEGRIVMAKQGNLLAVAFHPELSKDPRVHEYFLGMIRVC